MQEISISSFFDTEDASHTLRVIFQVPIDSTLVEDISIYFKDGNPLPKDVYQYIMDHINVLKWINPPQELFESDFSFPESRGVAAISSDLIFEHNDFDDNHFYDYFVPYDMKNLRDFYFRVKAPMTKSAKKAAARLLQHHNGDIEAAAQMLAKIQF